MKKKLAFLALTSVLTVFSTISFAQIAPASSLVSQTGSSKVLAFDKDQSNSFDPKSDFILVHGAPVAVAAPATTTSTTQILVKNAGTSTGNTDFGATATAATAYAPYTLTELQGLDKDSDGKVTLTELEGSDLRFLNPSTGALMAPQEVGFEDLFLGKAGSSVLSSDSKLIEVTLPHDI